MLRPHLLAIDLLLREPAMLDQDALLSRLQAALGKVESVSRHDAFSGNWMFAFPDHLSHFSEGVIPMQIGIMPSDAVPGYRQNDFSQSWDFPDLREALSRCRASIRCFDLMAVGVERGERLAVFQQALLVIMEMVEAEMIFWQGSQRFTSAEQFRAAKQGKDRDLIYPALNVRQFRVDDREPHEMVMDTIGLGNFGLPDLQCHFKGLDPEAVSALLYTYGHYLFEKGNIIKEGNTLPGISSHKRWMCHRSMALVGPEREVIDLEPHDPFRAH